MAQTTDAPEIVQKLAVNLSQPKPMRRGSLSVRYLKCNKPGCACGNDPQARHGPYTSVVRTVGGRSQSRAVPVAQAELLRQQVEAGQQFRKHVEAYWEACEQWADAQLQGPQATSKQAAKRGGSKKRSTSKSSVKLKR
jgi:Family of unknown function (DUF6788)